MIWAVGRKPNTDDIGLDKAGVEVEKNGMIPVDAYQNTNVPGIYAIGDIIGKYPLTPVAIAAGRRLSDRLFDGQNDAHLEYETIPTVVFAHPALGTVGLTEPQAVERFGKKLVTVYETTFTPMRYALSSHGFKTAMKLVCVGKEERVAGLHIVGDGARDAAGLRRRGEGWPDQGPVRRHRRPAPDFGRGAGDPEDPAGLTATATRHATPLPARDNPVGQFF